MKRELEPTTLESLQAKKEQPIIICRTTLKVLSYSFVWPNESEELDPGKMYILKLFIFVIITGLWAVLVLTHLVISLLNHVDVDVSENVAFAVAFFGLYLMVTTYVWNQKKTAKLLSDLSNFDNFGKPPTFEAVNKRMNSLSIFFLLYSFIGVATYNFIKLAAKGACERRYNIEKGLNENCGFVTAIWVPFPINYFPMYEVVWLFMITASQVFAKMALIISFKLLEITNHIIVRIDHLKSMILECCDDPEPAVCHARMKRCVMYHLEILDMADRLNDYFSDAMFVHLTITGAVCGCLENQLVKSEGIEAGSAVLHIFGWVFALFVACFGGQQLINSSLTIPETLYESKWYQIEPWLSRDLQFILLRSQPGLSIKTGSFSFLSLPLFVSVMKMSYSILTVLTA